MECLFCGDIEKNYKPEPGKDIICSTCVQILVTADQTDLKQAHVKSIDKGQPVTIPTKRAGTYKIILMKH